MREEVIVHGRRVVLSIDGPDADRRFNATIREIETDRLLTRNPVRGRSVEDARDRALEVTHNLLGIERLAEAITAVARELAPGAQVDLTEDAHAISAELSGPWELAVPFAVSRDDVYDPGFDLDEATATIRAHFDAHLRRVSR